MSPVVRRACHVYDIGRVGVSNRIWEECGQLSEVQWERAPLHPYLTARILERVGGLGDVARIEANHYEQPDGGATPSPTAAALPAADRILAAAVGMKPHSSLGPTAGS
jgi:response regulator RpfG family c-di-GMP phosphodiesterase